MTTRGLVLLAGMALCGQLVGGAPEASAAEEMSVMTLNTWHGGGQAEDGVNKIVRQIRDSGTEVVALQETSAEATRQIADGLGWNHTSSGWDIDVVSAAPIDETDQQSFPDSGGQAVAAKIHGVWVYSVHLDYTKYGPYNACFDNDSYPDIYADEETRKKQAEDIAEWTGGSPAIVAGDFNSPSHRDWTESTQGQHCDSVVEWPSTKAFADADFEDSYRAVHPSEVDSPGNTWSPVVKDNPDHGKPEPQDRIDFVLSRGGGLSAVDSETYGGDADWPSDHLAVVTTFSH